LGYSLAKGFSNARATVVMNGINEDRLHNSVAELKNEGCNVSGYAFDVINIDAVRHSIEKIDSDVGLIDCLINNAGIQNRMPIEEMTLDIWKSVIR